MEPTSMVYTWRGRCIVLAGKRVLVTAAGGSLGSEVARQPVKYKPSSLALVERAEYALFRIEADLAARSPSFPIEAHLVDIRDPAALPC